MQWHQEDSTSRGTSRTGIEDAGVVTDDEDAVAGLHAGDT
ncbi:hypothetical protein MFUL124B02_06955 [Myxococcus fulvus 124B02]|nr:hypothetical protein MFUL124B02_06955 [Myxococcus fulvus 124B02]